MEMVLSSGFQSTKEPEFSATNRSGTTVLEFTIAGATSKGTS